MMGSVHRRLLVTLLAVAASLAPGPLASTLTVTSTADNGAGSLRDAIAVSSSGDEIDFDPSMAGQPIVLTTGELVLDKDLTITGLGADQTTLSGPILGTPYEHVEHRLFVVPEGIVATLSGLSLVRGSTFQFPGGGAILNEGSLTLRECVLSDNWSATSDGGALFNSGSLVLLRTVFLRNSIEDFGVGAGLFNAAMGHAQMRQSSLFDNQSLLGGGSAIANAGEITAEECVLGRNRTFRRAGAILNWPGATFHLTRSIVRDNFATFLGGGAVNHGTLVLTGSTVAGNTIALRLGFGGGISNSGRLILTNSTILGNGVEDAGGHGGGVFNSASGSVALVNATVTGNYLGSSEYGGAAGLENAGTAMARGSLLAGNYALSYCYVDQPQVPLSSDIKGVVDSLGQNAIGGCTDLEPATCSESIACSGFRATDLFGVDVGHLLESEPFDLWPWAGGSPRRGLLASNGGPTPTVAPLPGSALVDRIPAVECTNDEGSPLLDDQRGTARPQGPGCDVGSVELSPPRGSGFWEHQCSGLGFVQLSPTEMHELFDEVAAASPAFPECAASACETLLTRRPRNEMRTKARRSLLALWLNLMTGRVTDGRPIDLPALTQAANVAEALAEIQATICDSRASRGALGVAKEIAEAINNQEDMDLLALESSAAVQPGTTRSFTLAVVNFGPDVRSYDLTASSAWPVALSLARVNGLGPGQTALVTATVAVPTTSWKEPGEVRVTASDGSSPALLSRTATIRIVVADVADPGGTPKPRRPVLESKASAALSH